MTSPELATVLKRAGWFSGKKTDATAAPHALDAAILERHCAHKENIRSSSDELP
ncbi:MAG TPA: hypothetical protein VI072_36380 [Polyangiaceae bacterium]